MERDARVHRDRHGRGPRGVTSMHRDFDRALRSALVELDRVYPTSMPTVTVEIEDRPTLADLTLAGDHVPLGRVVRHATPVLTLFRVPLEARADGDLHSVVSRELRQLVEQAVGR